MKQLELFPETDLTGRLRFIWSGRYAGCYRYDMATRSWVNGTFHIAQEHFERFARGSEA